MFTTIYSRPNPQNTNEAILSWGDTGGFVNALHFNSATIALFERPPAPAGEKQGKLPPRKHLRLNFVTKHVAVSHCSYI